MAPNHDFKPVLAPIFGRSAIPLPAPKGLGYQKPHERLAHWVGLVANCQTIMPKFIFPIKSVEYPSF